MSRPLRIEYQNAFYHVMSRGLERRAIFVNKQDYEQFLSECLRIHHEYGIVFHGFCLMPNHYHLLLQTPNANLSRALRHLNATYAQYFNKTHKRIGPLFQGRYKALLVDEDNYLLELSRYIHLNPVKAYLCQDPKLYLHSSYQYFLDRGSIPPFLKTELILGNFSSKQQFGQFTIDGLTKNLNIKEITKAGYIIGDESFCERIKEKFITRKQDSEIPGIRKVKKLVTLQDYKQIIQSLHIPQGFQEKILIYTLRHYSPFTLKEIADKLEKTSHHGISKIVIRIKKESESNEQIKLLLNKLDEKMSNV